MSGLNQKLKQITAEILFSGNDFGQQYSACNALYQFFAELTGISDSSENAADAAETILTGGKAISPKDAAHCVLDFARTTQFLRGIHAAISELENTRFPGERLEILYAGCGPFAALIVPLLTQFGTKDFRVTLIDYHQRSIDSVKNIVQKLQMREFIADFVQTDAAVYKHRKKLHLVICETMQTALKKEPQAAVTLNLAPQLAENGIFIPQKISVSACLAKTANGSEPFTTEEEIRLGEIFLLDAEKIRQSFPAQFSFPRVTVEIPPTDFEKTNFILVTGIHIFDEFELNGRDSGITYPKILSDLHAFADLKRIEFRYILGKNPRFEYQPI